MNKNRKLKIIIIALIILLIISLAVLTTTLIYDKLAPAKETSVVVGENIITHESDGGTSSNGDSTSPDSESGGATSAPADSQDSGSSAESTAGGAASESTGSQESGSPVESTAGGADSEPAESSGSSSDNVPTIIKDKVLSIYKNKPGDSEPFSVKNMFPGDSETKNYYIKVSHKGDITVKYHADIHSGSEKLAEVLKIRIAIPSQNTVLYDGVIKDMPASLDVYLATDEPTDSYIDYEITAYLETSVGNEYMDTELLADFRWWVENTENLDAPQTGDNFNLYLWSGLSLGSLLLLILLLIKRKKEDTADEQ